MYLEVAVPAPVHQTYTYSHDCEVAVGMRVSVAFGGRKVIGVVLACNDAISTDKSLEIKEINSVVDQAPMVSPNLIELAKWVSAYYIAPIGEVIRTMTPASVEKRKKTNIILTDRGKAAFVSDMSESEREAFVLSQIFAKRKTQLRTTVNRKLKDTFEVSRPQTLIKVWTRKGWVRVEEQKELKPRTFDFDQVIVAGDSTSQDVVPDLRAQQIAVIDQLKQAVAGLPAKVPVPQLLWGVTGSGKTEVYLQLIEEVFSAQRSDEGQILVLVPEISLTPQMTRVFSNRFPGKVTVVHSGMSDSERWEKMQLVRSGAVSILIGPRSAVFAPFRNLMVIIVDEEHDSSYKQATGVCYSGRDVAIMRARLEKSLVVLGSATPSLESFYNAQQKKYELHVMPDRVSEHGLPEVELLRAKPSFSVGTKVQSFQPQKDELLVIDQRIISALETNRREGNQAIVLVNRRGFAYYLLDAEKREAVQCPNCSISMTLHNHSRVLKCHYCDHSTTVELVRNQNPGVEYVAVGYGSQRIEERLKQLMPESKIERLDSDTGRNRDNLSNILDRFRTGKTDVLVGTQILAKGHDFPKVTLVCLLEVDQAISLPDFRAGERAFQLLVQASGRAGRASLQGRVLVQTFRPEHDILRWSLSHDYQGFAKHELEFRRDHSYPPFNRLILIEYSSSDLRALNQIERRICMWIERFEQIHKPDVQVVGPVKPPIEVIRNRYRRLLLLSSKDLKILNQYARMLLMTFERADPSVRMKVDVDPQSLM
jgi:primosomal protein N' (replication factor Y) (superfamily II helicase)